MPGLNQPPEVLIVIAKKLAADQYLIIFSDEKSMVCNRALLLHRGQFVRAIAKGLGATLAGCPPDQAGFAKWLGEILRPFGIDLDPPPAIPRTDTPQTAA